MKAVEQSRRKEQLVANVSPNICSPDNLYDQNSLKIGS